MTLAQIKSHVWKSAADVVLYYKSNGAKPSLETKWAAEKERLAREKAEAEALAESNTAVPAAA